MSATALRRGGATEHAKMFMRAVGRDFGGMAAFALPLAVGKAAEPATHYPLTLVGFVCGFVAAGAVCNWFGNGKLGLGLWLWVLSWALVNALGGFVVFSVAVLRGDFANTDLVIALVVIAICAGVFVASWNAMQRAEARR
jgi:hypothetical protein